MSFSGLFIWRLEVHIKYNLNSITKDCVFIYVYIFLW